MIHWDLGTLSQVFTEIEIYKQKEFKCKLKKVQPAKVGQKYLIKLNQRKEDLKIISKKWWREKLCSSYINFSEKYLRYPPLMTVNLTMYNCFIKIWEMTAMIPWYHGSKLLYFVFGSSIYSYRVFYLLQSQLEIFHTKSE